MENKYYTPSPDEFHIGFEYECQDEFSWDWDNEYKDKKDFLGHVIDGKYRKLNFGWFQKIFDGNQKLIEDIEYIEIDEVLEPKLKSFRVKYLDREDIESLGFKKTLKNQWVGYYDYLLKDLPGEYPYFLKATLHIDRFDNKYHKIYIHRFFDETDSRSIEGSLNYGESECIYKGDIKNKSELKKLMKQLNIYE